MELSLAPIRYERVVNLQTGVPLYYEMLMPLSASELAGDSIQEFVTRSENSGIIALLDRAIFEAAIDRLGDDKNVTLGVNLSYVTIQAIWPQLLTRIKQIRVPLRSRLIFEITETVKPARLSECHKFIVEAKKLGVKVALDDYGCGHHDTASPTFFNGMRFMPDIIKIDGSIMKEFSLKKNMRRISAVVSNARTFGLSVVAEHIETQDILEFATHIGIEYGQGFHINNNQSLTL